ncbi:MAG: hypothetical protein FD180_2547 [Planctomycetota bacterium]|nr:MAG: hypothetical protein FD180_2547 [Planctomycetota bacterium]
MRLISRAHGFQTRHYSGSVLETVRSRTDPRTHSSGQSGRAGLTVMVLAALLLPTHLLPSAFCAPPIPPIHSTDFKHLDISKCAVGKKVTWSLEGTGTLWIAVVEVEEQFVVLETNRYAPGNAKDVASLLISRQTGEIVSAVYRAEGGETVVVTVSKPCSPPDNGAPKRATKLVSKKSKRKMTISKKEYELNCFDVSAYFVSKNGTESLVATYVFAENLPFAEREATSDYWERFGEISWVGDIPKSVSLVSIHFENQLFSGADIESIEENARPTMVKPKPPERK